MKDSMKKLNHIPKFSAHTFNIISAKNKMKVLMVFVISLLGLVVHSDEIVETLSSPLHAELVKKFGNEKCENEKIGELSKDHVKCTQAINREDISEVNNKNNDFQAFVQINLFLRTIALFLKKLSNV